MATATARLPARCPVVGLPRPAAPDAKRRDKKRARKPPTRPLPRPPSPSRQLARQSPLPNATTAPAPGQKRAAPPDPLPSNPKLRLRALAPAQAGSQADPPSLSNPTRTRGRVPPRAPLSPCSALLPTQGQAPPPPPRPGEEEPVAPMAAPQRPRPRPRPQLARINAMKHSSYPGEDEGADDPAPADLSSEFASQTSFRIRGGRGGRAEVDDLFRKLGLSGPEDFTIPPALYAAAMAHIPNSARSRRQSLEASLDRGAEVSAPQELPEISGRDVRVAARLEATVEGERAVLATKVVQPEAAEVSAGSHRGPEAESGSRVIELETAQVSRREVAAVVELGNAVIEKGKGDPVKVDQLRVERAKAVVLEAPRETTRALVQVVAESTSRDIEHWISPSPHRRFKRTITTWIKGEHLGSGSFGSVYEAISDDGFFFAVKEVSLMDQGLNAKQRIVQLEHEISLLSRLEHENIVQYFGTDKEGGKLYIFLELVTQGSLAALYQKYHLQDSQVSAYTRQILNGLHYLHQRNVLHRDIKCANILVDASGLVKLADFGLAKEMSILSQARSSKGTVFWMAPEVAKAKPHGPPADIWSLGCTVLEMLTGKVPYPDMEWTHALLKIGRGIPPEIPNTLSEDARDFIHLCVQANPNDRPSAAQLLEHPFVQRPLQHYGA